MDHSKLAGIQGWLRRLQGLLKVPISSGDTLTPHSLQGSMVLGAVTWPQYTLSGKHSKLLHLICIKLCLHPRTSSLSGEVSLSLGQLLAAQSPCWPEGDLSRLLPHASLPSVQGAPVTDLQGAVSPPSPQALNLAVSVTSSWDKASRLCPTQHTLQHNPCLASS